MASLTGLLINLIPLAIRGVRIIGRIARGHLSISLGVDKGTSG